MIDDKLPWLDGVKLAFTPDDVLCACCGKEICRNTQRFLRDGDWFCSVRCLRDTPNEEGGYS